MALTMHSMVFKATLEQVQSMADVCGLRTPYGHSYSEHDGAGHYLWEDPQTGGGGCRLVWKDGVVWVSRHSGYAYADITGEVCDLFRDMGCKEYPMYEMDRSPKTYPGEWRDRAEKARRQQAWEREQRSRS